ncbi:10927_t:CDS:1, partial [Paraglomus brasilianum]
NRLSVARPQFQEFFNVVVFNLYADNPPVCPFGKGQIRFADEQFLASSSSSGEHRVAFVYLVLVRQYCTDDRLYSGESTLSSTVADLKIDNIPRAPG